MESKWSQINYQHRQMAITVIFIFYITLLFVCVWVGYISLSKLSLETASSIITFVLSILLTPVGALYIHNFCFPFKRGEELLCFTIFYCLFAGLAIYSGYEVRQMDRDTWAVLRDIGNVSMAVVAILGIVAVCIENYFRYRQTRKFGVPFRVTHHSLYDAAGIVTIIFVLIGLGIIFPTAVAISDLNSLLAGFLIVLSTCVALMLAMHVTIKPDNDNIDKIRLEYMYQGQRRSFTPSPLKRIRQFISGSIKFKWESLAQAGYLSALFISLIAVLWVLVSFAYVYVALVPLDNILIGTAIPVYIRIFILIYILVILAICVLDLNARINHQSWIFSKHVTPITTVIDGVLYLVTVRYSSEKWIMIPCTTEYGYLFYKKDTKMFYHRCPCQAK